MSRGLTDPIEPEQQPESSDLDNVISELIKGQNKLHDRIIDLERKQDHTQCKNCKCKQTQVEAEDEAADRKFWKRGL